MTLELRLRPEAELDLADASVWYEEQSPGLGHQFLDEVLTSFSTIAESPLIYPVVHRNTRRALMHRLLSRRYFSSNGCSNHAWQSKSPALEKPRLERILLKTIFALFPSLALLTWTVIILLFESITVHK